VEKLRKKTQYSKTYGNTRFYPNLPQKIINRLLDLDTSFQTVFDFIGNPHKLWASGDIENQKLVLKLVFSEQLPYSRNSGFQTP
jgi:hypothetical protein